MLCVPSGAQCNSHYNCLMMELLNTAFLVLYLHNVIKDSSHKLRKGAVLSIMKALRTGIGSKPTCPPASLSSGALGGGIRGIE